MSTFHQTFWLLLVMIAGVYSFTGEVCDLGQHYIPRWGFSWPDFALPCRSERSPFLILESGCIASKFSVRTWREEQSVELQSSRETHVAANFSDWAYVAECVDLRLSSHFKARRLKRSGCVLTWICRGEWESSPCCRPFRSQAHSV